MYRRIFTCIALVAGLVACHNAANSGPNRLTVITRDEIDSSSASNVYDLIARLHSEFLKDRGKVSIRANTHERAVVFLNDQEYGIPETMRNIPTSRIAEIRYFSPTDAAARYGSQYGGGVILLISRSE